MFPDWLVNLPWNIFDTLISLAELLVVCLPAIVAFMYYRIQKVSVWPIDVTNIGATIIIHNKTNKSIFLNGVTFIPLRNAHFEKPVIAMQKGIVQLKSDEYVEIVVNYSKLTTNKQAFKLVVKYDKNKQQKIKVVV